jgi:hypothetical protein
MRVNRAKRLKASPVMGSASNYGAFFMAVAGPTVKPKYIYFLLYEYIRKIERTDKQEDQENFCQQMPHLWNEIPKSI